MLAQVSRVLGELLADHWGEMIGQTNSATISSRYTQLFQVPYSYTRHANIAT